MTHLVKDPEDPNTTGSRCVQRHTVHFPERRRSGSQLHHSTRNLGRPLLLKSTCVNKALGHTLPQGASKRLPLSSEHCTPNAYVPSQLLPSYELSI